MLPSRDAIHQQVQQALYEDLRTGDLTAALIPEGQTAHAKVIAREQAILCGCAWFDEVMGQMDPAIHVSWHFDDGAALNPNDAVCQLAGPARPILSGERTALNFLQLLSGTATAAKSYVDAVAGTQAKILDTRKTLPGLRLAQKYAVTCGGAYNHRIGLFDAILIKENHILAAGSLKAAVEQARQSGKPVEVEVENLDELEQALAAAADRAMLDNFSLSELRRAVALAGGRIELEASGNVTLDSIREIAATGVNYISVGAITKNLKAVDFSMRFES